MYEFKMKFSFVLSLFAMIMENNIHLINLKDTLFTNMVSRIKPKFHTTFQERLKAK